jgi:gliding motility-associated-like protein
MVLRFILSIILFNFISLSLLAQIDTAFWFVAPEITPLHADRPIFLRIASYQKAASITITQPANPDFAPISQTLAANSAVSIDLTYQIDQIENTPPDQITPPLKYGILITSSNPITAYYEVLGTNYVGIGVNSDIFVLKGSHGLGTEFYTPFQTHWDNDNALNAWAAFDIVATEDNTVVTITPTKNIYGVPSTHLAGVSYNVVLQKGETYSAQAASYLGLEHPTGSHIKSNKPIAVTVKDDSIMQGSHYDLAGDQITPINFIGKEYIAVKVSDSVNSDRLYIVATKANTIVYLNGSAVPSATLSAGQTFEYQMLAPTTYVTATDSVYVWHVAGYEFELGGAILPAIGCTGSRQVNFSRSTDELFYINIVVKSGYEQYFKLNGNSSLIPASAFGTVAGTSGNWKYAQIFFNTASVPVNSSNIIENDSSDFQLAVLNGSTNLGFRYAYFSDYGFSELSGNKSLCQGDSLQLDAGFLLDSYLWNTGAKGEYITVKDSGYYAVTITKGVCHSKDSVHITYYPKITTSVLGNDTAVCANAGLSIKTLFPFSSYLWNNGTNGRSITPNHTGNYNILVKNKYGCKKRDTMFVTLWPTPEPIIQYDTDLETFCKDAFVHLNAKPSFPKYQWSTGDTTASIVTIHNQKDDFTLTVTDSNGCKNTVQTNIDCSPIIGLVPNLMTPNNDGLNDIFYVEYLRAGTWTFEVYNRWGASVYKNSGYDNTFDAKNLDDGIYYFLFYQNEGKGEKKGWLQILR